MRGDDDAVVRTYEAPNTMGTSIVASVVTEDDTAPNAMGISKCQQALSIMIDDHRVEIDEPNRPMERIASFAAKVRHASIARPGTARLDGLVATPPFGQ